MIGRRPPWRERVYLGSFFGDEDLPFEERRDRAVAAIRATVSFRTLDPENIEDEQIIMTIEELAETDTADYFDVCWDAIYDWADDVRLWIDVYETGPRT